MPDHVRTTDSRIPSSDRRLIRRAFKEVIFPDRKDINIRVKRMPRSGRSGACVMILGAKIDGVEAIDYVAKLDTSSKIALEWQRYNHYIAPYGVTEQVYPPPRECKGRGILVAHHATLGFECREFEELFQGTTPSETLIETLQVVFAERLKRLGSATRMESCVLLSHYEGDKNVSTPPGSPQYLSREGETLDGLQLWTGCGQSISLLRKSIRDLVGFARSFPAFHAEVKVKFKYLHGDLHPRNILVDSHHQPHLIDFGWAHRGHALKDYVLLEASLFLFACPRSKGALHSGKQHPAISLDQIGEAVRRVVDNFAAPPHQDLPEYLKRAIQLTRFTRANAIPFCIWRSPEAEYYSSLFLVVLGLIQHPECNAFAGLYLAEQLADWLQNRYRATPSDFQPIEPSSLR